MTRDWQKYHHHHHLTRNLNLNLSLNEGYWGTTDDFTTSFLHFLCSPLSSGNWRTPDQSIPWCCLPTSSSVCFVFFPLSLCLARWFWPDLMNERHACTSSVYVSYDGQEVWISARTSSLVIFHSELICSQLDISCYRTSFRTVKSLHHEATL